MSIIRNIVRASALFLVASVASANTLSLSGPGSVNVGDSFQLLIEGDFSSNGLLGGGSTFGFDPALVSVTGISLFGNIDPGFSCPGAVGCPSTANSTGIWWGNFSPVLNAGHTAPFTLAIIDLTALPGAGGLAAFTLADDPAAGGWADVNFGDATPTFSGVSVDIMGAAVVPVPAAVWLFGSGLIGLVGVARRRTAA